MKTAPEGTQIITKYGFFHLIISLSPNPVQQTRVI
jgi:hypothetical protein